MSSLVATLCLDPSNTLLVSVVSLWEIVIKQQTGKLTLQSPLADALEEQQRENGIQVLPVRVSHVLSVEHLPLHHKDSFDRLLIAQAITDEAAFLSQDSVVSSYPVQVLW